MDAPTDRHAAGVAYHRIDGFPKDIFRCEPWRATLAIDACEKRWRQAQAARGEEADRLAPCRTCQIGAAHAGQQVVYRSPLFGAAICPRCERGTCGQRMIGNRLCLVCYNRHREVLVGKNARGKKPIKLKLAKLRLGIVLDSDTPDPRMVVYEDLAVDLDEMKRQVWRTVEGHVEFIAAPEDAPAWTPPHALAPGASGGTGKSAYL